MPEFLGMQHLEARGVGLLGIELGRLLEGSVRDYGEGIVLLCARFFEVLRILSAEFPDLRDLQ